MSPFEHNLTNVRSVEPLFCCSRRVPQHRTYVYNDIINDAVKPGHDLVCSCICSSERKHLSPFNRVTVDTFASSPVYKSARTAREGNNDQRSVGHVGRKMKRLAEILFPSLAMI